MGPITFILNSNRVSYEKPALIPDEFEQLSFTGFPKSLQVDINNVDLAQIEQFLQEHSTDFMLGYFGYDFGRSFMQQPISKNESLSSIPIIYLMAVEPKKIMYPSVTSHSETIKKTPPVLNLKQTVSKSDYFKSVTELKKEIQLGNIYEINYCIPFVANNVDIDPFLIWERLCNISPMPFAGFIDHPNFSVISASPERFIKKKKDQLFIQPMKGTKAKGKNEAEDELMKLELKNDPKEKSENVMIVDLTRNDLSKIAKKGTVKVPELFGVYSYQSIHQMISTVTCEIDEQTAFMDILKATFPMGSMTGAPKSRAVELIDQFENFSRGPFSGMLGYINPSGNFDFSVMIRTIFYDKIQRKLFVAVGSAITSKSDVEKEYEECLIKLQPLLHSLNAQIE